MAVAEKTLLELIRELSPELQRQVRDFTEFLLEQRRREAERARQAETPPSQERPVDDSPEARGWPPGYFDRTAGVLANEPSFERPPQGTYEVRERLD